MDHLLSKDTWKTRPEIGPRQRTLPARRAGHRGRIGTVPHSADADAGSPGGSHTDCSRRHDRPIEPRPAGCPSDGSVTPGSRDRQCRRRSAGRGAGPCLMRRPRPLASGQGRPVGPRPALCNGGAASLGRAFVLSDNSVVWSHKQVTVRVAVRAHQSDRSRTKVSGNSLRIQRVPTLT